MVKSQTGSQFGQTPTVYGYQTLHISFSVTNQYGEDFKRFLPYTASWPFDRIVQNKLPVTLRLLEYYQDSANYELRLISTLLSQSKICFLVLLCRKCYNMIVLGKYG